MTHTLIAEQLAKDPRVAQAKDLLRQALQEHQGRISQVRGPQASLVEKYHEAVERLSKHRGMNLYYPYMGSGCGNGALVELGDGSVKYDFISGIGPHYFGHGHPMIVEAALDAALGDTLMQGNLQQNDDAALLMDRLVHHSGMDHCFLTTSGSMAVDNAVKIAFQHRHPAARLLAFERCFAGRSLAASQITDKPEFRDGIPTLLAVDYIPYFDPVDPVKSRERAVAALQRHIARYPRQHAAMLFELVQGEGGCHVGDVTFFEALIDVLKKNNILVIADEVQTFARTPELFAYQYFGLDDAIDIVTIGKAAQVCATLYRDAVKPRPGLLSQTFIGSTAAIRGAIAILDKLTGDGFLGPSGKIAEIHHYFSQNLENLQSRYPDVVAGPFGLGGMIAFTPYKGEKARVAAFAKLLYDKGLITFVAGENPTRIRMLPPLGVLTIEDIDNAIEIIEKALVL